METGAQLRKRKKCAKSQFTRNYEKHIRNIFSDVEIERRETIRANLEAAVTRKNEISPEAADLLQRLPDLSFLNNPMHS